MPRQQPDWPAWQRCWLWLSWWSPQSELSLCRYGWWSQAGGATLYYSYRWETHTIHFLFFSSKKWKSDLTHCSVSRSDRLTVLPPQVCCVSPPLERRNSPGKGRPAVWHAPHWDMGARLPSEGEDGERVEDHHSKRRMSESTAIDSVLTAYNIQSLSATPLPLPWYEPLWGKTALDMKNV